MSGSSLSYKNVDIRYAESLLEFLELTALDVPQQPASERQGAVLRTWDSTSKQLEEGVHLDHVPDVAGRQDQNQCQKVEE